MVKSNRRGETNYLERFGPQSELTNTELAFIDLMRPDLAVLSVVLGNSPNSRRIGDLGEGAHQLSVRLHQLGIGAYREGVFDATLAAFSLAIRCRLQFSDFDDRDTLTILRHWSLALREDGKFEEALAAQKFVLDTMRRSNRSDSEVLDTQNDIALLFLDIGDYRRAISLLRSLVDLNRQMRPGGATDPHTLTSESNLADAIKMSGDYRAAHALAERVWRDRLALPELGPDHPDTLTSANNLAELRQQLGDLNGSLCLQEEVLKRRRTIQPNHPDTVTASANLATTLYKLGQWHRAEDIERQVLRERQSQSGANHPDTLTAANNLAGTLRELGEFTEAADLLKWVIRQRSKQLGLKHPETLSAMTNLADLLQEQGELAAASRMAKRAWRLREESLSPDHHDTLTSLASYAAILFAQGKQDEALRHQRRILDLRQRIDGSAHIDTLHVTNDLATMLSAHGLNAKARQMYEQIEAEVSKALGPGHPDTIEVRLNLAEVLYELNEKASALHFAVAVLEVLHSRDVMDARDFQRSSRLVGLLVMLDAREVLDGLFARFSALMWTSMELLNIDSAHRLLKGFAALHDTWLRYGLSHALDELPLALAALHGIESVAWVRAELDKMQVVENPEKRVVRQRYADTRQALADARIQIQQLESELNQLTDRIGSTAPQSSALRLLTTQLRARHKEVSRLERLRMVAYREARKELERSDPALRFSLGGASMHATEIQGKLHDGEAVILLIQLADLSCAALIVHPSQIGAVLLPELESLRVLFAAYETDYRENAREVGLRDCVDVGQTTIVAAALPPDDEAVSDALSTLEQSVHSAFWRPLEQSLTGIEMLHVVYAPSLRGFGLHLGANNRFCGFYPSLPGFLRIFESTRTTQHSDRTGPSPMEVGFDCAWGAHMPIPFSKAEALLLHMLLPEARLHTGRGVVEFLRSAGHARTIHLACHGGVSGVRNGRHSLLLLDWETGSLLKPTDVASLPGEIDEFVCSTCVGGVVSQRVAVDAIGIVSAMQLKGVRGVVACLAPVPDFYMPLLTGLYWYERRVGATPAAALDRAKHRLLSAQWPDYPFPAAVRSAYATVMEEVLAQAQYAGAPTGEPDAKADRANRLALSVGSWVLPDALHAEVLRYSAAMTPLKHRRFSLAWCESATQRQRFAAQASEFLVEGRNEWVRERQLQLRHLCAVTQCFGGLWA